VNKGRWVYKRVWLRVYNIGMGCTKRYYLALVTEDYYIYIVNIIVTSEWLYVVNIRSC
jgi:hypothetical protein